MDCTELKEYNAVIAKTSADPSEQLNKALKGFLLNKYKRINGNDLIALGYDENHAMGVALKINKKRLGLTKEEMLQKFKAVLDAPASFLEDPIFAPLAEVLMNIEKIDEALIALREEPKAYAVYGAANIEEGAIAQMNVAMTLPVAVAGALMPDAHQGYGLPIGGVLATHNAIIPYGVGVDIGCRMALSFFDLPATYLSLEHDKLKKILIDNSKFGAGQGYLKNERSNHAVLDDPLFETNAFIRQLKDKAWT